MEILSYNRAYDNDFYKLNVAWLKHYFYVEPFDEEVLSHPEKYIISRGGQIFFALIDEMVVGTVALMPFDAHTLELTKMAVDEKLRGKGIGKMLIEHSISFAKSKKIDLLLYSHTKLENAIHIYRKYGFVEIPLELDSPYKRSDIKMRLKLT